jgi:hypothetical protein
VKLDGAKRFERRLHAAPRGRVGVEWNEDAKVLFDDLEIAALLP